MLRTAARSVLGSTAAIVDRVATLTVYARPPRRRTRPDDNHESRMRALTSLAQLYADADTFFPEPVAVTPRRVRVRAIDGGVVEDLSWDAPYEPFAAPIAQRYADGGGLPSVRMFRHGHPPPGGSRPQRPVMILVHGYLGGKHHVEERVWPTSWFFRRGLDLAFFVLPHHGPRGPQQRFKPPRFPGRDPRVTNEGFRHAMFELRCLVSWLLAQGHPSVGIMGMSLGGYTTALAATLESRLACAVPIIPLGSFADFARDHGRLGRNPHQVALQHQALDAVHQIVSPLHRHPVLAPERMLVVGARADRITPVKHAERLATHFGVPLWSWHGGHLLQFGRSDMFRRIGRFLSDHGMMLPPR